MRQALALCLDRAKVNASVLLGLSSVPVSFVPQDHPGFSAQAQAYPFDPAAGSKILEQMGWWDTDANPATPRIAVNVENIPIETPLKLTYITTSALQRRQVSEVLAASLGQCGIGVEVKYLSPEELYAPGPQGLLFGRAFDLAEFAMASASVRPACQWFTTAEIPGEANNWIGTNVSGYGNADFDKACRAAQTLLPDDDASVTGLVNAIHPVILAD
jgi:peptide/nickel transport system substrate-binding protein